MATSVVEICNLALQKLGAERITDIDEDSPNARECNACYERLRDRELRRHPWTFAKTRAQPAPSANSPLFDYTYAFPLPSDCLRVLKPEGRVNLDWKIESKSILTNDGASIDLSYIRRVTDPNDFDDLFVDALASAMALQMCERITQSNSKKADARADYKTAVNDAKAVNAIEQIPADEPDDEWLVARL